MTGSAPPRDDTRLTILVNAHCPHCLQAVDHLTDWCVESGIPVAGLDLWTHPEVAGGLASEHSPTLVFAGAAGQAERVHVGMPTHEEFLRLARA